MFYADYFRITYLRVLAYVNIIINGEFLTLYLLYMKIKNLTRDVLHVIVNLLYTVWLTDFMQYQVQRDVSIYCLRNCSTPELLFCELTRIMCKWHVQLLLLGDRAFSTQFILWTELGYNKQQQCLWKADYGIVN